MRCKPSIILLRIFELNLEFPIARAAYWLEGSLDDPITFLNVISMYLWFFFWILAFFKHYIETTAETIAQFLENWDRD